MKKNDQNFSSNNCYDMYFSGTAFAQEKRGGC